MAGYFVLYAADMDQSCYRIQWLCIATSYTTSRLCSTNENQHVMWAQINMFRKQLYSDFNKKIALIHRKSLSHADRHRHTPYYWIGYIIHPKPISLHTNLLSGYYFAFVFFSSSFPHVILMLCISLLCCGFRRFVNHRSLRHTSA